MLHRTTNIGAQPEINARMIGALVLSGGHERVLWAVDLDIDAERLVVHVNCRRELSLLQVHIRDVVVGDSHRQVVGAKDLQIDIKGLLVHRQGFLWLPLVTEQVSNAAQTQSRDTRPDIMQNKRAFTSCRWWPRLGGPGRGL